MDNPGSGPSISIPKASTFVPKACMCQKHKPKPVRPISELILDCWQRLYGKRPYENLILHGNIYRSQMFRNMNHRDFEILISFLRTRKHVKALELAYMKIPNNESIVLGYAVYRLEKLSLICVDVPVKLLEILSEKSRDTEMRMLRLSGNELTKEHVKHLKCFLMHSTKLLYLDVGYCDLDECTFAMLADGVHKSKSLQAVDMSRIVNRSHVSCIDENKIASLVAMLIWRCPLVELHLKKCGLDSEAIAPIVEYIATKRTLLYLDLGSNKIEGSGVLSLLKAIIAQNNLIGLDISNNRLGKYGGEILAHHLPETNIRYLDIGRNSIPAKQIHLILTTIKKPYQIRIFNIVGNEFDVEVARTLARQTKANTLLLETLDVAVTYDVDRQEFRVVPTENALARYNERYYRTANPARHPKPFFIQMDDAGNLSWNKSYRANKVLVNGIFVGPVVVSMEGDGNELNKYLC